MAALLLTVDACYPTGRGLMVLPCVPLKALTGCAEFRHLQQGSRVELRLPDGTRRESEIVTYGAPVGQFPDGKFYVRGGPDGPEWEIRFTLPADLRPEDVPPGTEIWYVEEGRA
jgi:hypothetical protein